MSNSNGYRKNHFIPEFYQKSWTGLDNCLCQYSRPFSNNGARNSKQSVKALRRNPSQTGFEIDLYSLMALPAEGRTFLEREFFRQVDQFAHNALTLLKDSNIKNLSPEDRSGWTRFVISLVHRHPDKVHALRQHARASMQATVYESERGRQLLQEHAHLKNAAEFVAGLIGQSADVTMAKLLSTIIDSEKVGNHILQMRWSVLTITNPIHTFLTSDRPVVMTNGINRPDSFIIVPMGPKQTFVAVNTEKMEDYLQSIPVEKFTTSLNDAVSRQACSYVYGADDTQLRFVENRLGKAPPQFIAGKAIMDARNTMI